MPPAASSRKPPKAACSLHPRYLLWAYFASYNGSSSHFEAQSREDISIFQSGIGHTRLPGESPPGASEFFCLRQKHIIDPLGMTSTTVS